MKLFAALALIAAPAAMAQGHDWRVLGERGHGADRKLYLVDATTLTSPTPDTRTLVVSSYFVKPQRAPSSPVYDVVRITYRFDCKRHMAATNSAILYDGDTETARGDMDDELLPAEIGTLSGDMFDLACGDGLATLPRITEATPEAERDRRFGKQ